MKGWRSEPFDVGRSSQISNIEEELKDRSGGEDLEQSAVGWPSATSFGSMFHRLVEIGLANPATVKAEHFNLSPVWLNAQENRLLANKEIEDALQSQSEWHRLSDGEQKQTRARILELATLLTNGSLGRMADGEEVNGCQIEGLRTEASFFYDHEIEFEGLIRTPLTSLKQTYVTRIDSVKILFEGQADLCFSRCPR